MKARDIRFQIPSWLSESLRQLLCRQGIFKSGRVSTSHAGYRPDAHSPFEKLLLVSSLLFETKDLGNELAWPLTRQWSTLWQWQPLPIALRREIFHICHLCRCELLPPASCMPHVPQIVATATNWKKLFQLDKCLQIRNDNSRCWLSKLWDKIS